MHVNNVLRVTYSIRQAFILYNILEALHLTTLVLVSKLNVSVIRSPSSQLVNSDKLKNRIMKYFIVINFKQK